VALETFHLTDVLLDVVVVVVVAMVAMVASIAMSTASSPAMTSTVRSMDIPIVAISSIVVVTISTVRVVVMVSMPVETRAAASFMDVAVLLMRSRVELSMALLPLPVFHLILLALKNSSLV
jgi:hypothetical protein